jgi:hypothetical protein
MTGCGGGTTASVKTVDTSLLEGNWLLTGSMPSNAFSVGQNPPFRLAVNFGVSGNVISAALSGNDTCTSGTGGIWFGSLILTGDIDSGGSFSVQTPAILSEKITIRGSVPVAGGAWSGSYSTAINTTGTCVESSSGAFTATPFPLVNGTYAGPMTVGGPAVPSPTSIAITIQQGGVLTNLPNISVLTGSIRVQGSSCFSSGVTDGTTSNNIQGNEIQLAFVMDDGSILRLLGSITDATGSQISIGDATVTGGHCGGTFSLMTNVLNRQ